MERARDIRGRPSLPRRQAIVARTGCCQLSTFVSLCTNRLQSDPNLPRLLPRGGLSPRDMCLLTWL